MRCRALRQVAPQEHLCTRRCGSCARARAQTETQTETQAHERPYNDPNSVKHMPGPTDTIPNYYDLMGVAETATADEIKRAYRKLARKYHPDVSKEADATERFKQLGEAYEVLKDPAKRTTYDDVRKNPQPRPGQFRRAQGAGGFNADMGPDMDGGPDFSDFYRRIFDHEMNAEEPPFGFTGRRSNPRGADVHARLALTLEEAFAGTEQSVALRNAQDGSTKTLKVRIPAGVTQQQEIRLKGQGGPGAPPGNLYIQIEIAPHPLFILDGHDILLKVALTPWEAALGHRIRVPTLGGHVEVNVPAGQKSAARMRLKGRGLPAQANSSLGDQYLIFRIEVPPPQNDKERDLYAELAKLPHSSVRADLEAWR